MHPRITITAAAMQEAAKDDETIDRAEAERRLREMGIRHQVIAAWLDQPGTTFAFGTLLFGEDATRARAILSAYVRGLDAKPTPIPDVSYALTILRERIATLDEEIARVSNRDGTTAANVYRKHRTTLEQTRDDLRKIERALLGDERVAVTAACPSRHHAYECALPAGHGGLHDSGGGFTRWPDSADTRETIDAKD